MQDSTLRTLDVQYISHCHIVLMFCAYLGGMEPQLLCLSLFASIDLEKLSHSEVFQGDMVLNSVVGILCASRNT